MGRERQGQIVISNMKGEMKRTSERKTQRDQMRKKKRLIEIYRQRERDQKTTKIDKET